MKVLMLNPPYGKDFCRSARWAAKSRGRVQRHPDWMLIAAAVLEDAGHEVKFVDGAALNLERDEIKNIIRDFSPSMVVIHTTTPSIYNDISYASLAKEVCRPVIVLIGAHVSAEFEDTFRISNGAVDIIALGEYDYTLRDIASGKPVKDIEGLAYQEKGAVIKTPERPMLDVRELPFPAWRHIKPEWYQDAGKRFPFLTLISGRGCFARCTFCRDTPVMYGRRLRLREPAQVVDEMEYDIKLFPYIREIMFETDTFTASRGHVEGVCEGILKRGLKISWSCNARVDIDLSLLPLMKKAGCRMLMVGFEFGTQEALDSVEKGTKLEQARRFAEEASRLGFIIHGCFMIGAPGETKETARATIEFAKSLPVDTIQISGICTYPGTEMYKWAKEKGYLVPKDWREWIDNELEQCTLLSYPQLSKEEIDSLIDEGLKSFYLRPRQMLRMALNMRNMGDVKRKLYGLKSFLGYFKKEGAISR
ncbi:MAG: radical SAM protein [Nitrospirae bacterium]|nr:radical SAM protein [Nitrospirota bacterium]MBI4839271.1 radical SAM protein [Nitrospirota bacterium]